MKFIITLFLFMIAGLAKADYYYFEAWSEDDSLKSQHISVTNDLPIMVDLLDPTVNESRRFYRIYITEAQYIAGWNALDQGVKDAGKLAAENYSKIYTNWNTQLQATIDALYDEINEIRTDPKLSLPAKTEQDKKDKVESKKKDPKNKKDK